MIKSQLSISDAAKELQVEAHVLRYWEEELSLPIPRNSMGHRVYGSEEIQRFRQIIAWKKEGYSLKEIQDKFSERPGQVIPYPVEYTAAAPSPTPSADDNEKMRQFKEILGRIVADAIRSNSSELTADIASDVSTKVNKELDFLFREKEEADEIRFRQLDETIRNYQKSRKEVAAASTGEKKKRIRKKRRQS
ncbi:MAG: helix-turn-helix domain-containing protein [Eubacterium sp.]|nr:helix-turn-helix domain-containing protein [Eubacterium sp.]